MDRFKRFGLLAGPLLFLILLNLPGTLVSEAGDKVLAVGAWMIVWWISEAVSKTQRAIETEDRAQDQVPPADGAVPLVQYDPIPNINYNVTVHNVTIQEIRNKRGALVDRGANGGIAGDDVRVFYSHGRKVNVTGIAKHQLADLDMVDCAARIVSHRGPIIGIFRNYAYYGRDKTIHLSAQIEHFGNKVDNKSMKVGGRQCIKTLDGYILPLDIINGLPYLNMQKHTDKEWEELPHVVLTGEGNWDPTILDNVISDRDDWVNNIKDLDSGLINTPFDEFGNYRR